MEYISSNIKLPTNQGQSQRGRCLAWYDASLGRWQNNVDRRLTIEGFDPYLKNVLTSPKDITYLSNLAIRHQKILTTDNASELHALTKDTKTSSYAGLGTRLNSMDVMNDGRNSSRILPKMATN